MSTTNDENVIAQGNGVDPLIHETGMATPNLAEKPVIQTILAHHTSPEDVGRVFQQAAPKLAVCTHMVLLGRPPVTEVIERTRQHCDGPLVIGENLMQFVIANDGTTMLMAAR